MVRLAVALSAFVLATTPGLGGPVERQIKAPGPQGPLRGALRHPATPAPPVVLIIPGSGPTDRDGNNLLGIKAATYRLVAEGLAARGIASVRIDKRGMFSSRVATPDPNAVRLADYVDDVRSWLKVIRRDPGADCVWLLGHSEGALVAMLAGRESEGLCGLLLVAAPGRPLGDVLRQQLRDGPANAALLDQALGALDALEAGREVDDEKLHPALLALFAKSVQGFLRDLLARDPAELIARVSVPVLILRGGRDLQVTETDAARLKAARPDARLVVLDEMNHVLKAVPAGGGRQANLAAYVNPDLPLADGVIDTLAEFIAATPTGGR